MQPLSSYTLADPKVMQNPYPYYERLRAEDPVHFDEGIRTWLVTRHEDILAVARNTEVYSDEMRVSEAIRSPFQAEVHEYMQREGFLLLDPADSFKLDGELHTRRRKLVARAFTGPAVRPWKRGLPRSAGTRRLRSSGGQRPIWSANTPCPYPSWSSAMPWGYRWIASMRSAAGRTPWWRGRCGRDAGSKPTSTAATSCSCSASSRQAIERAPPQARHRSHLTARSCAHR